MPVLRIAEATAGLAGKDALVAFADAWRAYAHAHPGRYTATQTPIRIDPALAADAPGLRRAVELEALSDQLVLACGEDSRDELPYRPAALLAERFGTELLHFPGGHTGLTTCPAEFADRLRETLRTGGRTGSRTGSRTGLTPAGPAGEGR